jgi:hypothetical protein
MIRIRNKTGYRARGQNNDTATCQYDTAFGNNASRVRSKVTLLMKNSFVYTDHAPGAVVVNGSPLARRPDESIQTKRIILLYVNCIAGIVVGIAFEMLRFKKSSITIKKTVHRWYKKLNPVNWVSI